MKYQITKIKLLVLIFGILSLIFPWMTITYTRKIGEYTWVLYAEYGFLGNIINTNYGTPDDLSVKSFGLINWEVYLNLYIYLAPFGILYLFGFMLSLFSVKYDNKNLKVLSMLSSIICTLAIIFYIIVFILISNRIYLEIKSYGIYESFKYAVGIGFGIISAILTVLSILLEYYILKKDLKKYFLNQS